MTTWRVRVEAAPPNEAPDNLTAWLAKELQAHDPYITVEYDGHLAISITVEAPSLRSAFDRGDKTVTRTLEAASLNGFEVVDVSVLTRTEHERRRTHPRVPRLAGVTEAGQILKLSNARIKVLADKYADRIPLVTQLAGETGAKIWLEETWINFNKTWDRKRTGRPVGSGRPADQDPRLPRIQQFLQQNPEMSVGEANKALAAELQVSPGTVARLRKNLEVNPGQVAELRKQLEKFNTAHSGKGEQDS